jgi:PQQ-dependent dehydrogenase (methanol/ethanol family)
MSRQFFYHRWAVPAFTAMAIGVVAAVTVAAQTLAVPPELTATATAFEETCAACHGAGGAGGDRAPPLANSARLRAMADADVGHAIRNGLPGGMPPFAFAEDELARYVALIRLRNPTDTSAATPQQIAAGKAFFFGKGACASCHMVRGIGGTNGPDLTLVAARLKQDEIVAMLKDPTSQLGIRKTAACPGWAFCPDFQWAPVVVTMRKGPPLRGFARNEAEHDLQLQTFDGKFRLLTEKDYVSHTREARSYMPPLVATAAETRDLLAYLGSLKTLPLGAVADGVGASPAEIASITRPEAGEWPGYDGVPAGNRYSRLTQIGRGNVKRLEAKWSFTPGGIGLQTTPVVKDGVMYVTGAQQVCALDARAGRSIWCTARNSGQSTPAGSVVEAPRTPPAQGVVAGPGPAAGARPFAGVATGNGPSRGVAILGDRVYFVSDDAYLVALNRVTGGVMWTVPLTDPAYRGRYYNTAAPLVVGDLIVAGVAGGDTPLRGFLVAFDARTGALAWRLWTIPKPGEPLAETWKGRALPTGGGATWTTGSYDPDAKTLYWAVGNPYPATDGDERGGSNLYTNSVVALDPATGKVKWHFQFTPHDLHDWDANAPLVLADAKWRGSPRKLLLQANRNGFFYVLDRTTGAFLSATPFVKKLTWATGVDAAGAPQVTDSYVPSETGTLTCPNVRGATNWYATSFNPATRLFYVMANEDCGLYRKTGSIYAGARDPTSPGKRYLRALNIDSGALVWEKPLTGSNEANYGGVLTTAGGLAFHGETGGGFAAVDTKTGKTLWMYRTNETWRATAMSYTVDGEQYVAVAAGTNVLAFALGGK